MRLYCLSACGELIGTTIQSLLLLLLDEQYRYCEYRPKLFLFNSFLALIMLDCIDALEQEILLQHP